MVEAERAKFCELVNDAIVDEKDDAREYSELVQKVPLAFTGCRRS